MHLISIKLLLILIQFKNYLRLQMIYNKLFFLFSPPFLGEFS